MPFDPLSYLQKHGFTEGAGLGKHQQGRSRAIIPGKKQDLTGIGHVEDWSNQTSRFSDVYKRSVQNIGVCVSSSSSSESEDEAAAQSKQSGKKRKRKDAEDSRKKASKKDKHRKSKSKVKEEQSAATVTAPLPTTNYTLGFGMSAVKFIDSAAQQKQHKATQYMGFTRAATLLSNGEQAVVEQATVAATVQPTTGNAAGGNNHSFKELTKAWSTVDSSAGRGFLTPLTNDVFEGERAHLYWNRVGSKLRRLHEQDQQFVATGTMSNSTSTNSLAAVKIEPVVLAVAPTSQQQPSTASILEEQNMDAVDEPRKSTSKKQKKDKHKKHSKHDSKERKKERKRSKAAVDSG